MNDDLQQQLIKDLLIESFEGLDLFDSQLLEVESGQASPETFNSIFRIIHTIKGTSGCLGLSKIEGVAHVGESLLSLLRDGKLTTTPEMVAALFEYSDALKRILRNLEAEGNEGNHDFGALLKRLQDLQEASGPKTPVAVAAPAVFGLFCEEETESVSTSATPANSKSEPAPQSPSGDAANAPVRSTAPNISDTAIRVEVGQLDRLMNLVGELVLARNQIMQHAVEKQENRLATVAQRLNLITTELQENVMKTRMLPIGNIWAKFPRIVRDLTRDVGKKVELVMEGNETEMDRTIIEAIKDPLTHILRNSIDHGIESPEARRKANKPEKGTLLLRAFHEGGQVNIEISDDGRGISTAKVRDKALEKGLITAEQAARLSNRDLANLVFLPGFSTAEKVTNLSGRGVGMDVVKTNIEKIGGCVDLQSEEGQGTTVKIKIPLTLAIIPALIVTSNEDRFAIPQVNLVELVRVEAGDSATKIENVFGAPVYRLRGKLLPLVYLNQALELSADSSSGKNDREKCANIVVLQADGQQFGLVVDEVNDTQEIVVKPLGRFLKRLSFYAGAAILGDGDVALILDVLGLAQHSHAISKAGSENRLADTDKATAAQNETQSVLIFSLGPDNRMAMPLASVGRLEKFSTDRVEREGAREVVQYRGQIMPLLRLSSVLNVQGELRSDSSLPVVVYSRNGAAVGLVVGEIVDVIEESVVLQNTRQRFGIAGSAVIQGKVTEFVDVSALIDEIAPINPNN